MSVFARCKTGCFGLAIAVLAGSIGACGGSGGTGSQGLASESSGSGSSRFESAGSESGAATSTVQTDWDTKLTGAHAVLVAIDEALTEEQLLDDCPIDGILPEQSLTGLAEEPGALMCLAGSSGSGTKISVGAMLRDDELMGLGFVDTATELGPGAISIRCVQPGCFAIWTSETVQVFAMFLDEADSDKVLAVLMESVVPVLEGVSSFDLALLDE